MATFQHPASLNALQQYRQASSILKTTSRASNPAWYQDALDLDFQLHVRVDGNSLVSFYHDSKKGLWTPAPQLTEEILSDPAKLESFAAEAVRHAKSKGAKSLGMVFHIGDEFATSELKPEFEDRDSLNDLRDAAVVDPASILADSSIPADQGSWRVLPYLSESSEAIGTTVTISRQYASVTQTFASVGEQLNFPLITQALSAPLTALMGIESAISPTPGKPFVAVLQYPWFTILAFFGPQANLRLIRSLQHRGVRRATNLRQAIYTTTTSLEMADPDLFVMALAENVDSSAVANIKTGFPSSRVEQVQINLPDGIPRWCPELLWSTVKSSEAGFQSPTFQSLRVEKWALQDFLPAPREESEVYPTRSEMTLLRSLRLARLALVSAAVLGLGYLGFEMFKIVKQPEWGFDPAQVPLTQQRIAQLKKDQVKLDHWNNLLEDRSKGWVALESFARLFPTDKGLLVKTYSHSTRAESAPGATRTGVVKEWKITGLAKDQALEYLNHLNTREGINAHFAEIARITGCAAYDPATGNRSVSVNVRTQESAGYKPDVAGTASASSESSYPYSFDLSITQRFEATDPIALSVPKVP